jgi:hypothetical protein
VTRARCSSGACRCKDAMPIIQHEERIGVRVQFAAERPAPGG